jgi:hypothetical protein
VQLLAHPARKLVGLKVRVADVHHAYPAAGQHGRQLPHLPQPLVKALQADGGVLNMIGGSVQKWVARLQAIELALGLGLGVHWAGSGQQQARQKQKEKRTQHRERVVKN